MDFIKLPDAENKRPQSSRWWLKVTPEELAGLLTGAQISLDVSLPISDPQATLYLSVDQPA